MIRFEEFAQSVQGQDFFGFVRQNVRYSSIGAIGEQSMGQVAYIKEAIKVHNEKQDKLKQELDNQQDIVDTLGRLDKLEAQAKGLM